MLRQQIAQKKLANNRKPTVFSVKFAQKAAGFCRILQHPFFYTDTALSFSLMREHISKSVNCASVIYCLQKFFPFFGIVVLSTGFLLIDLLYIHLSYLHFFCCICIITLTPKFSASMIIYYLYSIIAFPFQIPHKA